MASISGRLLVVGASSVRLRWVPWRDSIQGLGGSGAVEFRRRGMYAIFWGCV